MTQTIRHADTDRDVASCFPVMRALRPHIASPENLIERVHAQASERYRILAAWNGEAVVGLAGYRFQSNLIRGQFCYVDDLVVAPDHRRLGLGARLLDAVSREAREIGVASLVLDTAVDNALGQRFYFRYGMLPGALRFVMRLD